MLKAIYWYELKYWLKKPTTYVYVLTFCFVAFMYMADNLDFFNDFKPTKAILKWINSPYEINYILGYFNLFFLFLLPAIIGASIYRDYKCEVYKILYSFPIRKRDYLLGKYLSALTVVLLIISSVALTFIIVEHLPGLNPAKMGEFSPMAYVQAFGIYAFLNAAIYGAIIFTVVSFTRSIYSGFGLVFVLLFWRSMSENVFGDSLHLISLFDPLAKNTALYITRFWGALERNNELLPLSADLLYNRALWTGVGILLFLTAYRAFKFHENLSFHFFLTRKGKRELKNNFESHQKITLPSLSFKYNLTQQVKNTFYLAKVNLKYILKSPMFYVMLLLGCSSIVIMLSKVLIFSDMAMLPTTRMVLYVPRMFFKGIMILLTFLYVGMLVHQDRVNKVHELVDSTAIPNSVFLFSKGIAILGMQIILLFCLIFSGVAVQLYNQYHQFEFGLYFYQLFVLDLMGLVIWAIASFLVHSFVKNTYLGLFILIALWFGSGNMGELGIETHLLAFNSTDFFLYSDLNEYGVSLNSYFTLEAYWGALSIIFLSFAYLLWVRGVSGTAKERLGDLKLRWTKSLSMLMAISLVLFGILGFRIYTEEQKEIGLSNEEKIKAYKAYTTQFSYLSEKVQPRITTASVEVDLYPKENRLFAKGVYTLQNKSTKAIDTLLVHTGFDELSEFDLNVAYAVVHFDKYFKFSVLKLEKSLLPEESIQLNFELKNKENTLFVRNSGVLRNGTFLMQDIFPRIGYHSENQFKLPNDTNGVKNHAYATDSDLIDFEAIVSTNKEQTVLAPGELIKEWEKGERKYFHYKVKQPIKYSLGINSARFKSVKENYKGIDLEVYYHKEHEVNVPWMIEGLKAAYDYNTKYFGPYQHKAARVIEFPQTEGTHATTYGNNILISELRFMSFTDSAAEKINTCFYIPAHELTHQWWGNQILPAAVFGSRMISESVTEYISLRIYEQQFGKKRALRFLHKQRERYLKRRKWSKGSEQPLNMVQTNQKHIFYGKGSMAFNTLSNHLGELKFNHILNSFLNDYRFKTAPYPTSFNLIEKLKVEFPDSLQYLIHDWFETVSFYENKIEQASFRKTKIGDFRVEVDVLIKKQRENEENTLSLKDYIEIGIVNELGELTIKKYLITKEKTHVTIHVIEKPIKVILDPNLLLLEENIEDNVFELP